MGSMSYFIRVRVFPLAKKESLKKLAPDEYQILVREPAQHNMANKRVLQLLAYELGVEPRKLRLITGAHSPIKRIEVVE